MLAGHSDISAAEWLGIGITAANDASTLDTGKTCACAAKANNGVSREVTIHDGFLAQELDGDIRNAGLVRRRFGFEFPDESVEALERGIKRRGLRPALPQS